MELANASVSRWKLNLEASPAQVREAAKKIAAKQPQDRQSPNLMMQLRTRSSASRFPSRRSFAVRGTFCNFLEQFLDRSVHDALQILAKRNAEISRGCVILAMCAARSTFADHRGDNRHAQPHHLAMIYHVRNESNLDTSTFCHSGLFSGKCPSRLQAVSRRLPRRVAGSSGISETSPDEL